MKDDLSNITAEGWICASCECLLELMPVDIAYMGSSFKVELPRCPRCGHTFIPPELAEGKMLDVERILEDK